MLKTYLKYCLIYQGVIHLVDIKARIKESGKNLFSKKGYKNTNVAEITKMAGVATGTFYN